ncbi:MAG: glycosyl hydrolase family 18 protein [Defluviitaleaceae bacterium]|nr:glycosyl hydrolase family 18 protein [Defluviitaleaceae bacterium]
MHIHVVERGDSLYSIGKKYGVDYQKIARDNEMRLEDTLVIGQTVVITGVDGKPKIGVVEVNGYAFANIADDVLARTLPHLTYLSLFSYEAREGGDVVPIIVPEAEDRAIARAIEANVMPALVVTNIGESGNFEPDLAHSILNDPKAVDNLLEKLLAAMRAKKYAGLDVDFEYVLPKDRQAYNDFLEKCAAKMHENGFFISCAVPAKETDSTTDALTGAYDYSAIGGIVDFVTLMTYEWGYSAGQPMAVAPIRNVESVVEFAATQMPSVKIMMGVPNYGYDWPTPVTPSTPGRAVGNTAAVELARKHNQAISFDEKTQTPFFEYYNESGKRHEVWFEDARSAKAKLELAAKHNLAGFSYWTVNRFWPQNWLVLDSMYDVAKG